jgi:glycosyltransferase involved in cell wall biosynthesis
VLNHVRYAQAALGALPDHVGVIPVLHNDVDEIYRVGCGNAEAWNVAVAVSPGVQARALRNVGSRRVVCIPPGVEVECDDTVGRRAPDKGVRVLFVGRLLESQKRVLALPDILQTIRRRGLNATLTVVGDGPDAGALRAKVVQCGLEHSVEFRGTATPKAVKAYMQTHHILLMPSAHEGFGLVLVEGAACGCVPVASLLSGVTDSAVVHGHTGYLVPNGDISQMAERALEIASEPELWERMSREGVRLAGERFSCETMGASYLSLFADVLRGKYPLSRSRRTLPSVDMALLGWRALVPSFVRLLRPGVVGRSL